MKKPRWIDAGIESVCASVAVLLVAMPLLLFGFPHPVHDEAAHLRWWHGFAGQFWQGEFYPRWLHGINHGFGSPAFFYYPPLPYWAAALFAPLAGDAMPGWRALGWASALGLVGSGLTALACFRKLTPGRGVPVCALLYMVMPYHLTIDLLERGAYAEFWAFVWMPLALRGLLGLRKRGTAGLSDRGGGVRRIVPDASAHGGDLHAGGAGVRAGAGRGSVRRRPPWREQSCGADGDGRMPGGGGSCCDGGVAATSVQRERPGDGSATRRRSH